MIDRKFVLVIANSAEKARLLRVILPQPSDPTRFHVIQRGQFIVGLRWGAIRPNVVIHAGIPQDERLSEWWRRCIVGGVAKDAVFIDLKEGEAV